MITADTSLRRNLVSIINYIMKKGGMSDIAQVLAEIVPIYLKSPHAKEYFQFWEEHGFHLTPVHFYQPIPDTRDFTENFWTRNSDLAGLDLNEAVQLDLLQNMFPCFRSEYDLFHIYPTDCPYEFYMNNGAFERTDALVLYCMIRHFSPKLIMEVGSGFSTRLASQAALRNGNTQLVCIDPNPDPLLVSGFPGLTSLIVKKVQEIRLDAFKQLGPGDILFIDSSHVVRSGGDVNYLFLEILPNLNPGVIIHIHDILLPREYHKAWMMEQHWFWTEQYLLQAFLAFNSEFEILFSNSYMDLKYNKEMRATFPTLQGWDGGSFWMRRKLK